MRPPERERGAALLTVLLLVAVIAVLAGTALERMRIATKLAGNAAAIAQARSYAMAAETLALVRIGDLMGQAPDRVTLAGGWSGKPFGLPLPGGVAVARVTDGDNCFNLNGLVTQDAPGTYVSYAPARVQFARLMRLLNVPAQVAEQIAAGASDWIDSDADQQAQGAEDPSYLAQTPSYRTAGTLMSDPSELRAVAGMTPQIFATLRPWLCTLPVAKPAPINLNTVLPEQAPLVAMLQPDTLSVGAASQAILKRPIQGYADTGAFWSAVGLGAPGDAVTAITSHWFDLTIQVSLGGTRLDENALVDASRLPPRLVSRQWGDTT